MIRAKEIQVNPIPVIVALVLVALGAGYFMFMKPAADEAKIAKEWNTPEQAALRGPGRPVSDDYKQKVQALLQKEGRRGSQTRRERE